MPEYVTLRHGPTLPLAVVELGLALEARGLTLDVEADDVLVVRPAGQLTDPERAAVARWRRHLVALVRYCDTATYHDADTPPPADAPATPSRAREAR